MKKKKDEAVARSVLDEALEAVLDGVGTMINEATQKIITHLKTHMDTRFDHQKDDMDGLKAEFSNTPSRYEFEQLRTRVQKLEKAGIN